MFQKTIKIPEEWDDPIPLNKYCTFTDGDWILEKHYSMDNFRQGATEKAHLCSFTPQSLKAFKNQIVEFDILHK